MKADATGPHEHSEEESRQFDDVLDDVLADWPAQRASTLKEIPMTRRDIPIDWDSLHAALSEPFPHHLIQYRPGVKSKEGKATRAFPYVDVRAYEDRLNQLVPGDWSVAFQPWGETKIICRLTIHGVTRSSTGDSSGSPASVGGTAAEAQAFKRACSRFGLGRHLYATSPDRPASSDPKTDASRTDHCHNPPIASASRLGSVRADGMRRALEQLGLPLSDQLMLCRELLQRDVRRLADLTESEARSIWQSAQERRARPHAHRRRTARQSRERATS